jgi:hypothetical protein
MLVMGIRQLHHLKPSDAVPQVVNRGLDELHTIADHLPITAGFRRFGSSEERTARPGVIPGNWG